MTAYVSGRVADFTTIGQFDDLEKNKTATGLYYADGSEKLADHIIDVSFSIGLVLDIYIN